MCAAGFDRQPTVECNSRSDAGVAREEGASMKVNRSVPPPTVVPVLVYPDVHAAVTFLTAAFGFVERTRIGGYRRAQMAVGDDGAVIIADVGGDQHAGLGEVTQVVRVRVADVDEDRVHPRRTMAPLWSRRRSTESTASGTAPLWISPATAGNWPRPSLTWLRRSSAARPSAHGPLTSRAPAADSHTIRRGTSTRFEGLGT